MSPQPVTAGLELTASHRRRLDLTALSDYWALTKPDVNLLIAITTFAGYYLASAADSRVVSVPALINTVLGTMFVAGGAGALNQYVERRFDAQMRRTSRRPLAAGRLNPSSVLFFGVGLSAFGSIYLAVVVSALASSLAVFTLVSYLFLYTPLKRISPMCTLVGAVPGAMPPLIGWAAASGRLSVEAWMLFALLFLWQFPHFMAIAWMYREDYDRAGYLVLPRDETKAGFASLQTLLPLFLLVPLTLLPALAGRSLFASVGAVILGLGFSYYGLRFTLGKSNSSARRLLSASIIYLPLLFALMFF